MGSASIRAYVNRDWALIAASKDAAWLDQRRRHGLAGAMRLADELRRDVLSRCAPWPTRAERERDLATHARVAEVLRRVGRAGSD